MNVFVQIQSQFMIMGVGKIVLFYGLFLSCLYTCFAQQKANKKCEEYTNLSDSFRIPGRYNIIGGRLAEKKEFPHMVALGYGEKEARKWLCGGTIISKNFILTAAHCVSNKELGNVKTVRVGVKNLKNEQGQDIDVKSIIKHPDYKPPSQYNDIALLKLKNDIQFSPLVLPACVNTVKSRTSKLVATGWGLLSFGGEPSNDLMKVELNLYTHANCKKAYKNVSKRRLARGIDSSTQICAGGGPDEEKDTCQGDSGGPLVVKTKPIYTVVGVTSFGKVCGLPESPGVYTNVSAFVPWIERNVWK